MYNKDQRMKKISIIVLLSIFSISLLSAITAVEIVNKMDELETYETSKSSGEIITTDRFGEKKSTFNAYSRGKYDSLIEFTSLAERGQKVLRTNNELFLYYPDANELIRLTGAALRQSLLGSDISYEDMTGEKDTLRDYEVTLLGTKTIDGRECYELSLVAKTRKVAYPKQTLFVDTETFVVQKGEYSTSSGRLLKEIDVISTMRVGERTIPKETKIVDTLKRNSSTIMKIDSIEIDIPLDRNLFSIDSLTW